MAILEDAKLARRLSRRQGLFAPNLRATAVKHAFVMLRPDIQWKNPVMFVVEVGTVLSIVYTIATIAGFGGVAKLSYLIALDVWLVSDGAVRQLRVGAGRSPRQGPGRCAAKDAPANAAPIG